VIAAENPSVFPQIIGEKVYEEGMTLRDWFAGQAINATIAAVLETNPPGKPHENVAMLVYQLADAMLAARGDTA